MKRYVEIFWCPVATGKKKDNFHWIETAYPEPKHLYPIIQKARSSCAYLKCPAVSETFKNSFSINAPFDLNITFNKESNDIFTDRYGQNFFDAFILNRSDQTTKENPFLFTLSISYLFFSHESVIMESGDIPLLENPSNKNFHMVPGGFDISKWFRPIELSVEVIDHTKPISLTTGDPLFMVRFFTKDNVPVKLTRIEYTEQLDRKILACTTLKKIRPNLNLKECYSTAESFIGSLKKWLIK